MTSYDNIVKDKAKSIADAVRTELSQIDENRPVTINLTINISPDSLIDKPKTTPKSSAMSTTPRRRTTAEIERRKRAARMGCSLRRPNTRASSSNLNDIAKIRARIAKEREEEKSEQSSTQKKETNGTCKCGTCKSKPADEKTTKSSVGKTEYESKFPGIKKCIVYDDNNPEKNTYHKKFIGNDGSTTEIYYTSTGSSKYNFGRFFW